MYELKDREYIIVFTGPDGSGRKAVADAVGQTFHMVKVLSHTTRAPRPAEADGQDYHFITEEQYDRMERNGEFLESIRLGASRYGIREEDVANCFRTSGCLYLILNCEGASILKKLYGDRVVRFFIYADRSAVEERQRAKGIPEDAIQAHMSRYEQEMECQADCEHAYENYDLAHTVFDITNTLEGYLKRELVERD
ncbi:guanylate kinase [Paenibacillus sp. CC-CFT747]|nr:guanylate kinase [Paenibacillus sp. CC-CFT747]